MMIKRSLFVIRFIILAHLFLSVQTAGAQQRDFQLRNGWQLNADLPKGFLASVQYQYRADQNMSHFRASYLTGLLEYKLIKNLLDLAGEYRYRTSYKSEQHRLGAGLTLKHKQGKFTGSYRLQYQKRYPYFNGGRYEPGKNPDAFWRNRLQVKYKWKKKIDIYASAEFFYKITVKGNYPARMRYIAGFEWEFRKRQHLNLYYLFQQQYNSANPLRVYAIGVNYAWDLIKAGNRKKKKNGDYF